MSNTTETTLDAPVSADVETTTPEVTDTPETPAEGNREAAKYRRQLRDTEAERDTLATQLDQARHEILKVALDGHKVNGAAFKIDAYADAGLTPAEYFTDDGTLDQARLTETMQALNTEKPYMFDQPQRLHVPGEGRSPSRHSGSTWAAAFSPEN